MGSWFPLAREVIESEDFQAAPPLSKLFYLLLIERYNWSLSQGRDHYDITDLEASVRLRCSEKSVQRSRDYFRKLGWITVRPGRQDRRGRGLATRYLSVKWATAEEASWFAPMDRHAFETMLYRVHKGWFQPADVVTYSILCYLRARHELAYREHLCFWVSKADLRLLTGCEDAPERVKRLYDGFRFKSERHLFEYTGYQRIKFTDWATFADPDEDENNARIAEQFRDEIAAAVKRARDLKQRALLRGRKGQVSRKRVRAG